MGSQDRFGYEWDKYDFMLPMYEKQFLMWIGPDLGPEDFKDKAVLDAGCGMGRNSYWPCKYGAKEVLAFDFDQRSVEAAQKTLKDFSAAKVIYKSIYDIDFVNRFESDHIHCLHVLNCSHNECPVHQNPSLVCYLETGSLAISPKWRNACIFLNKYEDCTFCPVYSKRIRDELNEMRNVVNTIDRKSVV